MLISLKTVTISMLVEIAPNSRWVKRHEHKDENKVDLSRAPADQTQFVRVYLRLQLRYAKFPAGVSMFREEMDAEMTVPPQYQSSGERMSMESDGKYYEDNENKEKRSLCLPQVAQVFSGMIARTRKVAHRNQKPVATRPESPVEMKEVRLATPPQIQPVLPQMTKTPAPVANPLRRSNAVRRPMHPRPEIRGRLDARTPRKPISWLPEATKYVLAHHPRGEDDLYCLSDVTSSWQPAQQRLKLTKEPTILRRYGMDASADGGEWYE